MFNEYTKECSSGSSCSLAGLLAIVDMKLLGNDHLNETRAIPKELLNWICFSKARYISHNRNRWHRLDVWCLLQRQLLHEILLAQVVPQCRGFTPIHCSFLRSNDPTVNLQILKCILVKSHFQAHFGKLLHDVLRALVLCDLSLVIEENHVCLVNVALEPQRCFNAILLLCILQLVAVHAHHKMYLTLCVILSHLVKSWNGCTSENLVPQSVKNATCLKWLMCMHVACIDNKWKAKYICDRHTKKCTVYMHCIIASYTCTSEHLKSSSNATLLAARDIVNVQLRLFVFTARHVALQEPESWSS